jgi:hypothetical protein
MQSSLMSSIYFKHIFIEYNFMDGRKKNALRETREIAFWPFHALQSRFSLVWSVENREAAMVAPQSRGGQH